MLLMQENVPSQRTGSHWKTEQQDNIMNESHFSSSVSSCSCQSFLFHRNGTASGFIKIYEPSHHWKYKTLVGAHWEMGGRGGKGEKEVVAKKTERRPTE